MDQFGENVNRTIYLKGAESHKLHHAFMVADGATVYVGQPVKLNAAGEVEPAASAEDNINIIGYSVHKGTEGDEVTIAMKAYALVYVKPNAAVVAGPVQYAGTNTVEPIYGSVAVAASAAKLMGWNINPTTAANEKTLVAVI